jgi:hypothetical protein
LFSTSVLADPAVPAVVQRPASGNDNGQDRRHYSDWEGRIPLILEDAQEMGSDEGYQPEYVVVNLDQGACEADARIWCGKGETSEGWNMIEGEARRLAAELTVAADLASEEHAGQLALPLELVAA